MQIQQASGVLKPWANISYPLEIPNMLVLDSHQWIQDVTFPARLYLKTLGVENLGNVGVLDQNEPLLLDGLVVIPFDIFYSKTNSRHSLKFYLISCL